MPPTMSILRCDAMCAPPRPAITSRTSVRLAKTTDQSSRSSQRDCFILTSLSDPTISGV